ncbi:MAG: hypothetical protein MUF23_12175 [Pirellula sp.]|nr:hypothetical protein [Pirellula sp.]
MATTRSSTASAAVATVGFSRSGDPGYEATSLVGNLTLVTQVITDLHATPDFKILD